MKRLLFPILALMLAAGCGGDDEGPSIAPTTSAPYSQTDLVVGTGAVAASGNLVGVTYGGWLHDSSRTDAKGNQFDSGTLPPFRLGTGGVIRGFDQGIVGMRVGGSRRIVIPPDLGYGNNPPPGSSIPRNATLVFDVTLNSVSQ